MIRKTLTILSLIGLVLSLGLWGVSYYDLIYRGRRTLVCLYGGHIQFLCTEEPWLERPEPNSYQPI